MPYAQIRSFLNYPNKTIEGKKWFEVLNLNSNKLHTGRLVGSYMMARPLQKEEGKYH